MTSPRTPRDYGSDGGKKSATNLTPEQRSERARKASNVRWTRFRRFRELLAEADAAIAADDASAPGGVN